MHESSVSPASIHLCWAKSDAPYEEGWKSFGFAFSDPLFKKTQYKPNPLLNHLLKPTAWPCCT